MRALLLAFIITASIAPAIAAELRQETIQAWDQYFRWADAKVQREVSDPNTFTIQNNLPKSEQDSIRRQLESGEIVVRQMKGVIPKDANFSIPDGEIHHWWGAILLRNTELSRLLAFLQDYDHHAGKFADVERSHLLSKSGDLYRVFFRLSRSKAFVTAVYDTEQECQYVTYSPTRTFSKSIAVKIAEIQNPGSPSEYEKKPGNDRGFLWRLVSWWRFEQRNNDTLVELDSASLSRGIPSFVKFIPGVSAYIRATPRESLQSVLESIRKHVK